MSSIVEVIAKQAQLTFSKSITDDGFTDSLSKLRESVKKLRAADLKLRRDGARTATSANSARPSAPVTYIEISENQTFSMGIFLLKGKAKVPLQDHSSMHGVLKVIRGAVRIAAYGALSNVSVGNRIPQDITNRVKISQIDALIPVEKYEPETVTEKNGPCVLRPKNGNYHEIIAKGKLAAFLYIFAPPYDMKERGYHYYSALKTKKPDSEVKTFLVRRTCKLWYDSARYRWPKVSLTF